MRISIRGIEAVAEEQLRMFRETRERWRVERQQVLAHAREISPVRTGQFRRVWRFKMINRGAGYLLINTASENGRTYAGYVHPSQDPETIAEKVRQFVIARQSALVADLNRIVNTYR